MKKTLLLVTCTFCLASSSFYALNIKATDDTYDEANMESSSGLLDYRNKYATSETDEQPLSLKRTRSHSQDYAYLSVFIEFPDVTSVTIDDDATVRAANQILNDGGSMQTSKGIQDIVSLKDYIHTYSYGQVNLSADIFPKENGNVTSYIAPHSRSYYLKKSDRNPNGYTSDIQAANREAALIEGAMKAAKKTVEERFSSEQLDQNKDGFIDAITFFIESPQGDPDVSWSDLLWPHKSQGTSKVSFNGKALSSYNLITVSDPTKQGSIFSRKADSNGHVIIDNAEFSVLEHEYLHIWGLPDLYRGYSDGEPVGFYDIMARNVTNPQPMTSLLQRDWLKWGNAIDKVYTSQTITLDKAGFDAADRKRSVKIISSKNPEEYFIAEYYTPLENMPAYATAKNEGILLYRVNTKFEKANGNINGNTTGEKDYVYIYRPGEKRKGEGMGDLVDAVLPAKPGTSFGKKDGTRWDNDTLYYSNGSNSGIVVSVVEETNTTVNLQIDIPVYDPNPITAISLDSHTLQMLPGATKTFTWDIAPKDATTDTKLFWESSDPSIASVKDGKVEALKNGDVTIRVTTSNGIMDECQITVYAPISDVTFPNDIITLRDGDSEQLKPTILPAISKDEPLTWGSSDPSIASVSQDGVVTGHYPGKVTITATSKDGPFAECEIQIRPSTDMIQLAKEAVTLKPGDEYKLDTTLKYTDLYTIDDLTWISLQPDIVTVENGMLKALKNGEATIMVSGPEEAISFCKVLVQTPITSISMPDASIEMNRNETHTISLKMEPADASIAYELTWESSDESIVEIDEKGVLHSKYPGSAIVKAILKTSADDIFETTMQVHVRASYVAPQPEQYAQVQALIEYIDTTLETYDYATNDMAALQKIKQELKMIVEDKTLTDLDVTKLMQNAQTAIDEIEERKIVRSDNSDQNTQKKTSSTPVKKTSAPTSRTSSVASGDSTNLSMKVIMGLTSAAILVFFKKRK